MDYSKKDVLSIIWAIAVVDSLFVLMTAAGFVIPLPFILAVLATIIIQVRDRMPSNIHQTSESANSPEHRDNTVYTMALLMEMMDEDERQSFKSRLQERILSGETVTDESLIMDMEKRKRG